MQRAARRGATAARMRAMVYRRVIGVDSAMGWRAEVQWPGDVVELDAGLFALNGCI